MPTKLFSDSLFAKFCQNYGVPVDKLLSKYNEDYRVYHTWKHVEKVLQASEEKMESILTGVRVVDDFIKMRVRLAILFHDAVYIPGSKKNEVDSALYFNEVMAPSIDGESKQIIISAILATKHHDPDPADIISNHVCVSDLAGFADFGFSMKALYWVFKEMQKVDWTEFKNGQIAFLQKYSKLRIIQDVLKCSHVLNHEVEFLKSYVPKIAVYPGSFNPFHTGHLDIKEKAEAIFDKVIMLRMQNDNKETNPEQDWPEKLKFNQTESYHGSLVNYLLSKNYPLTVIRGVRNGYDLDHEMNMYYWNSKLLSTTHTNYKTVIIPTDFVNVSSSALRNIAKYDTPNFQNIYDKHVLK